MKSLISAADQIIANVPVGKSKGVVLVDVAGRKDISPEESNANIYCIDTHGSVIWQVSATAPKMEWDSFVSFRFDRSTTGSVRIDSLETSSR